MVQGREYLSPTNAAQVWFLDFMSYVGWVCCWFSSLCQGFLSRYSGFPPSTKTNIPKFQFNLETVHGRVPLYRGTLPWTVSRLNWNLCGSRWKFHLFVYMYLFILMGIFVVQMSASSLNHWRSTTANMNKPSASWSTGRLVWSLLTAKNSKKYWSHHHWSA